MVPGNELARLSLTEVGALIAAGEVSAVEVTRNSLDRLDRYAGPLGAATAILHDAALADARRAEREILAGDYRGPLHGVPARHQGPGRCGGRGDHRRFHCLWR